MDVENIINNLELYYLNNLKKSCLKKNLNDNLINKKINSIDKNISDTVSVSESDTNLHNLDDYVFKKDWNKLHLTHKKIKIKQFVKNLNITDTNEKKDLINKLIGLLNNKKLTKKTTVNYNIEEGFITSIPNLEFKNNKYIINI